MLVILPCVFRNTELPTLKKMYGDLNLILRRSSKKVLRYNHLGHEYSKQKYRSRLLPKSITEYTCKCANNFRKYHHDVFVH